MFQAQKLLFGISGIPGTPSGRSSLDAEYWDGNWCNRRRFVLPLDACFPIDTQGTSSFAKRHARRFGSNDTSKRPSTVGSDRPPVWLDGQLNAVPEATF